MKDLLHGRGRRRALALAALALAAAGGTAGAAHLASDTDGHTTVEQTLVPSGTGKYKTLVPGAGEPYVVRPGVNARPQTGRHTRRKSLAYVSQLTDFQLADEESPARVEFLDPGASSAWRPQEGFTAFQIDATVRQVNHFAAASPVAQGDGTRNRMDFALLTGDQADNQHLNETVWVRDLLEGNGPLNFNSGLSQAADYANPAALGAECAAFVASKGGAAGAAAEGGRYTGVQDYDDYPFGEPITPLYYDPDHPHGPDWEDWPRFVGLMDHAQQIEVDPVGLDVPFYITNGNHDVLVQGNEDANQAFEDIATGCLKVLATTNDPTQAPSPPDAPDPSPLLSAGNVGMLVPPDPARQFVSKPQIKQIYGATDEGPDDDDHGFAHVDPAEETASRGSASYYAWRPQQTPGMRFISIDTNAEGGQTTEGVSQLPGSSNGNLDDPQFQWIKRELRAARERDELVVLFGHHPVRSLSTQIRDEQAVPCTVPDDHGHDVNPGCDLDPRPSDDDPATPGFGCIHNGTDAQNTTCPGGHESFVELLDQFPNVVAYVPGHTHEHRLTAFTRTNGTTWWEINTSAVIDPPNQSRLIELMDNRDGTLSWFNTVIDHSAPASAPGGCETAACTRALTSPQLASLGRTFAYNDPQNDGSGLGRTADRNAELLLEDPRPVADLGVSVSDDPDPATAGQPLTYTLTAHNPGTVTARGVTITAELPAGARVTDAGGCLVRGRTLECPPRDLAPDGRTSFKVTVVPDAAGELAITAHVRGNVSDRVAANDSDTEHTTVEPAPVATPTPTATATATATADPTPTPTPTATATPTPGARPRPTPTPTPPPHRPRSGCANPTLFERVAVRPLGRRLRFSFVRRGAEDPVDIDLFQVSRGRRVLRERLVAPFFRSDERAFTWTARRGVRDRRVRDGYYFARFRTSAGPGARDTRRVPLRRAGGRWSLRPPFYARAACGTIAAFKLERPVFGGRPRRSLGISYVLGRPGSVRLDVLRRGRVVRTYRDLPGAAGVRRRVRFGAAGRRRGDYSFRLTIRRPDGTTRRTLVARRL